MRRQAGPGNDINAGSPGFQKAPTRGLPAWSPGELNPAEPSACQVSVVFDLHGCMRTSDSPVPSMALRRLAFDLPEMAELGAGVTQGDRFATHGVAGCGASEGPTSRSTG